MKYKIAQLESGRYKVYKSRGFLRGWVSISINSHSSYEAAIDYLCFWIRSESSATYNKKYRVKGLVEIIVDKMSGKNDE